MRLELGQPSPDALRIEIHANIHSFSSPMFVNKLDMGKW
jgi:hypothetical protein